ncbi:MAG: hypothetical protein IJO64_00440 [Clostridia bacterium]|nr:hypothetical protein [Clostridia bacterium]
MKERKVIYYTNELNDEFSTAQITPKAIDGNYKYISTSLFNRFSHFFFYRIIATPIAYLYPKVLFENRIIGAEKLKEANNTGYFIYGNHTQDICDAFIPNGMDVCRDKYFIVHPNNVSIPLLGRVTPLLGAIPLPDNMEAYRNFIKAIETRIAQKKAIVIYPEAHIWPYYTKIRPFKSVSFQYPIKHKVPAFCFTNTYQKRKLFKKPKIITYIDGPFYPDESLPLSQQRDELRNRIFETMCERAKCSNAVYIEYIKRDDKNG